MAIRKFVFLDPTTGQYKEQTSSDSIQVADGVNAADAVNKGQLDAVASAASSALSSQVASLQAEIDAVEASVAAEESRAMTAESGLQSAIEAEAAARATAIQGVEADVAAEETRALAAEAALQAAITAEETARIAAVSGVQSNLDAVESALEASIAAESAARVAAVAAEKTRAETAEAALQANIDAAAAAAASALATEIARAEAAEAGLQSAVDLLNAADTVPGSVAYDIKAAKDALETMIEAEESARIAQDAVIAGQISDLTSTVSGNYSTLSGLISAEQARAEAAEAELAADILAEETARIAGDSALQSAIDGEAAARAAAVTELEGDIAAEASARAAAITAVEGQVTAEAAARAAADTALQGAIDAEEARALAAEGVLSAAISAEEAARIAAVSAVQASLNTEISDRQAAVASVQSALDLEISARTTQAQEILSSLATEVAAREAGDTSTLAAAKLYADGLSSGLKFKDSVRFAMPVVYDTGEGQSFNLPAQFPQQQAWAAEQEYPVCEVGDRVLLVVKDGVSVDAGIYVVVTGGTLQRAPDMAVGSDASGAFVYVEDNLDTGAPQMSGSSYVCANQKDNDIVGTAALSFVIFSRMENLTFRFGVEKTGMNQVQIKLNQTNPGLVADGSGLKLKVGDFNNLAIDSNGLKMTGTLVDGKMGLADDLHSHSVVGVKIASSESVGVFVKAGGTAVSQSSPDVLGLVIEKSGGDALVVTHGVVVKTAASFSAGDTLYVADGGGSFVSFADVQPGKYAIPVAKKIDGTKILVQIGTAVLKA